MEKAVVLVVEDEALIRMSAAHMVEDAGFASVEAGDADEAMAILEGRDDIRAVFTDIKMPGSMDGWKLAHAIRGRWSPIHLIITSGLAVSGEQRMPEKWAVYLQALYGRTCDSRVIRSFRPYLRAWPINARHNATGVVRLA